MACGSSKEVMLMPGQLTKSILDDAQSLRKNSRELRHACRNTRNVSILLRGLAQREINLTDQVRRHYLSDAKQSAEVHGIELAKSGSSENPNPIEGD
jgi:hypothetical protein